MLDNFCGGIRELIYVHHLTQHRDEIERAKSRGCKSYHTACTELLYLALKVRILHLHILHHNVSATSRIAQSFAFHHQMLDSLR